LIALKVGRIQRELDELTRTARERAGG